MGSLESLLRDKGALADERWREWAARQMRCGAPTVDALLCFWEAVLAFDSTLAAHVRNPITVPQPCVIVAGSGKETFKTFNVSTGASILAAAAGARVVKGVSASVSATSGSADVLNELRIPTCGSVDQIPERVARDRIAFVPYAAFCPSYADRYDDVFPTLNPFSFFVPAAVLAVQARAFVYGIAHRDVGRAAATIAAARPDVGQGTVVASALPGRRLMDERCPYGVRHTAEITGRDTRTEAEWQPGPSPRWSRAVWHRNNHRDNMHRIAASLEAHPSTDSRPCVELVEHNAALIFRAHQDFAITERDSLEQVQLARRDGEAMALLERLAGADLEVRRAS